jgi:hypothetical protein
MSFAPERLPPLPTAAGDDCLPFNFGHVGGGPVMNLMQVHRLLADGVRPDWLLLEVMPAFVSHEGWQFISLHTAARDFPALRGHMPWYHLYGDYLVRRLELGPKYPGEVLRRIAPAWAPAPLTEPTRLLPLGGCPTLKDDVAPADRERLTALAAGHLHDRLRRFRISPRGDRATRALLDVLRHSGVRTVLVLLPEGPTFESWYGPGGRELVGQYCADLGREYAAKVVDARRWLTDADFYDSHHVLRRGAEAFTDRLGRDVLRPYLAARVGPGGRVGRGAP